MAAVANFSVDQGATFSTDVTVKDSDGNALDLTDYTASAKMALGYSSTRTRVTISTTIENPTNGVLTLTLTDTQTDSLEAPARYVYDVEITNNSDNTVIRVLEGIMTIRPSVSI